MNQDKQITHEFVEFIPERMADDVLYISIEFSTAAHKCACGCGTEVVTALSPDRWQLLYDGETVSLTPSIGNWGTTCQSHYFIRHDRVIWAKPMSPGQIKDVRSADKWATERHLRPQESLEPIETKAVDAPVKKPWWQKVADWFN